MMNCSVKKLISAAAAAVLLTGCGVFEPSEDMSAEVFRVKNNLSGKSVSGADFGKGQGSADLTAGDPSLSGPGAFGSNPLGVNPNNPYAEFGELIPGLQFQPVYFHFDQSRIEAGESAKLDVVADYLKGHPGTGVVVEGNCDSKGSDEYNRALGERRALAAKDYLIGKGIAEKRIRTISYGEERPAVPGEDEPACQKNRRDEFVGIRMNAR